MTETTAPQPADTLSVQAMQALGRLASGSYRDADVHSNSEVALWRPRLASADAAILKDAGTIRARARDLVRNDPIAKNAVRMNRDAVTGSGLKLSLKIDWRMLGLKGEIEEAAEWQDHVTREWEAYAESIECQMDARRQRTFSQLMSVVDQADFVDGESLAVVEMKQGFSPYQTCLNLIDIDRLSNPMGQPDSAELRAGIRRDVHGEPLVYCIRDQHPSDISWSFSQMTWTEVPRVTPWGRPIVFHTYDHTRPEMTRGVSEFASVIVPAKMLQQYNDTELQSAILQAAYAAVIKTELDWATAAQVLGGKATSGSGVNPLSDYVTAHMLNAAEYHSKRNITFQGSQIPVLMPNESLDVIKSTHPNSNFGEFETVFIRKLAAGLGVEAHELGKNYKDVNYSAARAALLAVWRTYRARRNRITSQVAMPLFGAWLEEAVMIGTVQLPKGVTDFYAAKPYLVRGSFIAWGKPMIDPQKERQAQQLGLQMGTETLEDITADDGRSWRDVLEQRAYERRKMIELGLDPDGPGPEFPGMAPPGAPAKEEEVAA